MLRRSNECNCEHPPSTSLGQYDQVAPTKKPENRVFLLLGYNEGIMQFRLPLLLAFISSIILLVLHLLALENFLYWSIPWLDILQHFLGGFTIGLTLVVIIRIRDRFVLVVVPIIGAFLLAFVWEAFEYAIGMTFVAQNTFLDSLGDILFSLLGAIVSGVVVYKIQTSTYDKS